MASAISIAHLLYSTAAFFFSWVSYSTRRASNKCESFKVVEATGSDMKNHSAETCMHGTPSKNSRKKKIAKEFYTFNSGFRDCG